MTQHGKRYRQSRGTIDRESLYSPVEAVRLLKEAPAAKFDETVEVHMNLGLNVRHADEQLRGTIDRESLYSPVEAVRLLKEAPAAKFDETVEVHMNLGLNVRHADEQLRGTMMLPHGTGREQRVAVFAEGDKAREAEEAGADVVGSADLAKRIEEGFTDFDVAIATPDQMGNVGRLGRVLGPRGLMPNPKTGTVTFDVAKAVKDAKAGKLEYRTDRGANVHIPIGKKSFDERALVENYAALIDEIVRAKPAAAKGRYIKKITLTSTMGPGIHIDPTRTRDIAEELDGATQEAEQVTA